MYRTEIFSDGYVVREQISKRCREKYVSDSDLWMQGAIQYNERRRVYVNEREYISFLG
jgi:hypothetical protein